MSIVITVFNGGPTVARCIESVLAHTDQRHRVVVIDDASDDIQTSSILDRMSYTTPIELVRHGFNLGYTKTANHGLSLTGQDDVVLLNSDTVVGPMWLQRLVWTSLSVPGVATVSAVSDDAAANSIPSRHAHNDWYPREDWGMPARLVKYGMKVWSQQVPSGHGFCMYVRRAALNDVGHFDEEAFPIGYGEEVDFSQRCQAAGWKNLVAPHVLVKHLRSESFGLTRRAQLVGASKVVLHRRYPSLTSQVGHWESSLGAALVATNAEWIRTQWRGEQPLGRAVVIEQGESATVVLSTIDRVRLTCLEYDEWMGCAPLVEVGSREQLSLALASMMVLNAAELVLLECCDDEVTERARAICQAYGVAVQVSERRSEDDCVRLPGEQVVPPSSSARLTTTVPMSS